jgi:outer membrane protein
MKVLLRLSVAVIFLTTAFGTVSAQKFKFGHTNSQKIIEAMPETKTAREEIKTLTEKHQKRFEEMQAEYEQKYTEILENNELADESPEKWDELTLEDKQAEFMNLQQRIQTYEQSAGQKINQKQVELFTPISEKVQNAIKEVAKEGGFTYIFDETTLLYFSTEMSIDVTDQIMKKLGITNGE